MHGHSTLTARRSAHAWHTHSTLAVDTRRAEMCCRRLRVWRMDAARVCTARRVCGFVSAACSTRAATKRFRQPTRATTGEASNREDAKRWGKGAQGVYDAAHLPPPTQRRHRLAQSAVFSAEHLRMHATGRGDARAVHSAAQCTVYCLQCTVSCLQCPVPSYGWRRKGSALRSVCSAGGCA